MQLFVPEIGTKIKLTSPWNFNLHKEYRNCKLLVNLGIYRASNNWPNDNSPELVTVPVGTILTVDRVYIRKGVSDYSSLTFNISSGNCPGDKRFEKTRFWAKLQDCNTMNVDIVLDRNQHNVEENTNRLRAEATERLRDNSIQVLGSPKTKR